MKLKDLKVWDEEGEEENADLRFWSLPAVGSVNSTIFKNEPTNKNPVSCFSDKLQLLLLRWSFIQKQPSQTFAGPFRGGQKTTVKTPNLH